MWSPRRQALADEHEALLAEARNTTDRLRLILDISNTIVANLELEDLLQVVSVPVLGRTCSRCSTTRSVNTFFERSRTPTG